MPLLNPQPLDVDGAVIVYVAATVSDTFVPLERGLLLYRTAGTPANLTVLVPGTGEHAQAKPDPVVVVGATAAVGIATDGYRSAADVAGVVTVTASSIVALTVAYVVS